MKKYKVVLIADNGVTVTMKRRFETWLMAFIASNHYKRKYSLVKEVSIKEVNENSLQKSV